MPGENNSQLKGRHFRLASMAVLACLLLLVVAGFSLTLRGQKEMVESDAAFHKGELRGAIVHARKAALSYLPGATHVKAARERLEAIARGAESEGRFEIARFAWDSLRLVCDQTDYLGRPASPARRRAQQGLQRLQHGETDQ